MAITIETLLDDGPASADGETRLSQLKALFNECRDSTEIARREAQRDIDYYHDQQWTDGELKELARRRQPPVTMNVVKDKVESICGVEQQSDTAPKAWPRKPNGEQAAEIATDTLRYVCDLERFDKARIDILRDMLISGTGGAIVEVVPNALGSFDIKIRKLRWETLVFDPFSRESDFSDARYLGSAIWMHASDVLAMYGEEAREAVEGALDDRGLSDEGASESYADRPIGNVWSDRKRNRVLVVELYHIEGGIWMHSIFTGAGVISSKESPYRSADGEPCCPIELASVYVNRNNERYGVVRSMLSAQDEINHRRSKMLHLLNSRQTYRKEGSIAATDPQALRRELNKPDGDIVLARTAEWGRDIGIIPTEAEISGQSELLQDARAFIDKQGANNALMGHASPSQSGRAILAQQQAGLQTLATLFAGYNDWILRIYRQVWARARQFWRAPMWVRVTDDIGSPKFVQINEPLLDAFGNPIPDPQTGAPAMRNRLAEMDVDLIVDRVPASANLQDETFKELIALTRESGLGATPAVLSAILASSPLRGQVKRQLLQAIGGQGQPDPMQAQMVQRKAMAEIAKEEAHTAKYGAAATKEQALAQRMMLHNAGDEAAMAPMMQQLQVVQALQQAGIDPMLLVQMAQGHRR